MTSILSSALMGIFVLSGTSTISTTFTSLFGQEAEIPPTYSVTMTGYNAVPEQTDEDPFTTASGAYSNPEVIAARSVDMAEKLPFGSVIEVVWEGATSSNPCGISTVGSQIGLRVIADSMHPRKKQQIDILLPEKGKRGNPARVLGVCKEIEIRVLGRIAISEIPRTQAELKQALVRQNLALVK